MKCVKYVLGMTVILLFTLTMSVMVYAESTPSKGVVIGDSLNVREEPSTSSSILQSLTEGHEVVIMEESSGWYGILLNGESKGWVHSDFIKKSSDQPTAQITGNNVNLRSNPTLDGNIVTTLSMDSSVGIKNFQDGWYHVLTSDNQEGWVHGDYVHILGSALANNTSTSRSARRTALGDRVVNIAKESLGKPYVYGANGPDAFDCSGFTTYVYKKVGISLPRVSRDQGGAGEYVSKDNLKTGDLVFFDTVGSKDNGISHAGIYIGDGEFIHASSGKNAKKVVISNLNTGYYKEKYVTARRVL